MKPFKKMRKVRVCKNPLCYTTIGYENKNNARHWCKKCYRARRMGYMTGYNTKVKHEQSKKRIHKRKEM